MIVKFILVCSLLASPTLASAVKGYADGGIKGGQRALTPVERHHEATATKTATQERHHEQAATLAEHRQWEQQTVAPKVSLPERAEQQRVEQQQQQLVTTEEQQREELSQQKEEHYAKGAHYEARTQVRLEESKGGARVEQQREELPQQQQQLVAAPAATKSIKSRPDESSIRVEQTRSEHQRVEQQQLEQQKLEQQRLDQQRLDQQRLEQQRLDLQRLEQQRLGQQRLEQLRLDQSQQQREEQQAVELSRDLYEQRRFRGEDQQVFAQQREESKGQLAQQQQLVAEPEPYAFDYSVEGSSRRESGDTKGVVRGQYTLQGADGSSRIVDYIADHNGFRATVNTNEFGTESRSPAGVEIRSSQPTAEDISLRLEGKTREIFEVPAVETKGAPQLAAPKRPENWSVKQAPISISAPAPIVPQVVVAALASPAEEAPRAIRGKTIEEIKAPTPIIREQQKLDTEKDLSQLQQQQQEIAEPAKELAKGELRASKAIGGELKQAEEPAPIGQLRAAPAFESATAHHVIVHSSPAAVVNQQHQRHHHPAGGLRSVIRPVAASPAAPIAPAHLRHHAVQPARAQFQYDRHAQPVGPLHQLRSHSRQEPSPRLSFYGGSNVESVDDSAASFEHPTAD